jgi:hypothetical protein
VVAALDECDLAVGRRWPLAGGSSNRRAYWLRRTLPGHSSDDLACSVRACRRAVLQEIVGCGASARYMLMVARERGFTTCEVGVRQGRSEPGDRVAQGSLWQWLRDGFGLLSLYGLLKLTRQPLRFFATIGLPLLVIGSSFTAWLGIERLLFGAALAGRPALILGLLMVVLGIQVVGLGLIGELILFVSGRKLKNHAADRVI